MVNKPKDAEVQTVEFDNLIQGLQGWDNFPDKTTDIRPFSQRLEAMPREALFKTVERAKSLERITGLAIGVQVESFLRSKGFVLSVKKVVEDASSSVCVEVEIHSPTPFDKKGALSQESVIARLKDFGWLNGDPTWDDVDTATVFLQIPFKEYDAYVKTLGENAADPAGVDTKPTRQRVAGVLQGKSSRKK